MLQMYCVHYVQELIKSEVAALNNSHPPVLENQCRFPVLSKFAVWQLTRRRLITILFKVRCMQRDKTWNAISNVSITRLLRLECFILILKSKRLLNVNIEIKLQVSVLYTTFMYYLKVISR